MQNLLDTPKIQKAKEYVSQNKKKSILGFILILITLYFTYKHFTATTAQTTYVLGTVQRDSIVASITETGQVQTNHSLDIKPKVSANVIYVAKSSGDFVNAGDLIATLDTTDAEKSVRDAQASLDSAQLSLQKLQEPADQLTLLQAQNALDQANSDLAKAYDDGFNNVSSAFIDLPNILNGIDSILHNSDVNTGVNQQRNIDFYLNASSQLETTANSGKADLLKTNAENAFLAAKNAYTKNFDDYKNTVRTSDPTAITNLVNETYKTTILIADAVKSASNQIQYYQDLTTSINHAPIAKSTTQLNTLSGYTSTVNTNVNTLSSTKTTITNGITSIPEKTASLQKIKDGADVLDVKSSELSVKQRQNALQDAKDNLADYYIRAPFSGTLSAVNVKRGDPAGSATAIATLIATDKVASVTINEVDAAKIKLGDKATLTFDAIDGLTLTGKVATIDTVGTVSQGVVNYTATISFDSTDIRVKPGMSVSASIITDTRLDVLTVPSTAIKTSSNGNYVLVFDTPITSTSTAGVTSVIPPIQKSVEIGLSDDTNTEIISGLSEGDQIITKTILPSTTGASTTPSLLSAAGGNRNAGASETRGVTGR